MEEKKDSQKIVRDMSPYLNLGMQMAITMALGVLAGWYMDKWNDSSPLYIVIFSLAGAAVGLFTFLRTVLALDKKRKKE